MLASIRKILYTTDMSENSRRAFDYTVSLAEKYDAEIVILHVIELLSSSTQMQVSTYLGSETWEKIQQENEQKLFADTRTHLKAFCEQSTAAGTIGCPLDKNIIVRKGIPMETILEASKSIDADLIVMGTHGYGLVRDALMGGTVRHVLRRSLIPVLVVPSPTRTKKA